MKQRRQRCQKSRCDLAGCALIMVSELSWRDAKDLALVTDVFGGFKLEVLSPNDDQLYPLIAEGTEMSARARRACPDRVKIGTPYIETRPESIRATLN